MNQYFFILGRNPTLSVSEITEVLRAQKITFSIEEISPEVLLVDSDTIINCLSLIKILGGTIKIGKILDEVKFGDKESNFFSVFSYKNLIEKYLTKKTGKINIGLSLYDAGTEQKILLRLSKLMKDINKEIKNNFRDNGLNSRFLPVQERYLSSATVGKNNVLAKGAEIIMIATKTGIKIGKTEAIQEFEQFAYRDFNRPAKDKRSGIMPPKLARILINLAVVERDCVLLDPFCGSGTILQEAILLDYKKIIGSDISQKAIADSRKNITWLQQYFMQKKSTTGPKFIVADVRHISGSIASVSVNAIVTEPYLGPPLFRVPNLNSVNNIFKDVGILLLSAFKEFQKILLTKGTIVVIFPAFEIEQKMYFLDILEKIEQLGFLRESLVGFDLPLSFVDFNPTRKSILYGGRDQFVRREILKFRKK